MRFSVYGLLKLKGMIRSTIDLIDWDQNVDFLVNRVGGGKEEAKRGITQFDVDGRKVEIQLIVTTRKENFLL